MVTTYRERFRTEQILEVACPKCAAVPGRFCDRKGERLSAGGRRLRAEGSPPSHQERMWLRQGHDPAEFDALRGRQVPGDHQDRGKNTQVSGGGVYANGKVHAAGSAAASGYGI